MACLDALLEDGREIVGVVGHPDGDIEDWYPSLPEYASTKGLPVYQPDDVNAPAFLEEVRELEPDLIVMAGYNQILGETLLSIPNKGAMNLHGGKLPEYRGASTLNWMIINGEREAGISILFADEGIDTGDIAAQERFAIDTDDTIRDIVEETDERFPPLLIEVLNRIEDGTLETVSQTRDEGTYYHSRKPRDGRIDWQNQTAKEVHDLVRSLVDPYPGAFTEYDGEKLVVRETALLSEDVKGVSGRVCLRRERGVVVVAADRGLVVKTVQRPEGDVVPANQFFEALGVDLG